MILFILALVSLNVWLLSKISFIFEPVGIVVKTVMFPVILAGVFYYLFAPLIDWAEKKEVNRGVSILLLFLAIIWGVVMAIAFVVPTISKQIKELIANIPLWWNQFKEFIESWNGPKWTMALKEHIQDYISDVPSLLMTNSSDIITNIPSEIFPLVGTVTGVATVLITSPFVLFYLLKDGKNLPEFLLKFVPVSYRDGSRTILREMNQQISSYIRGQIIISFCIGVLLFIGYLIIGLPYALTLAIIAALTSVVPYVGPIIAITPAVCLAIFTSPILLIKIAIVWVVVQALEGKVITPQIMGKSIKVHPLTILFTILCAGKLFGVLGLVLAIPGYAVLKVVVSHCFAWIKDVTNLYEEKDKENEHPNH